MTEHTHTHMISFAVQKLLSLIRTHLFILYSFSLFQVVDVDEKRLLRFMSRSVLVMFPSESFIVSGLTFRSLIHSDFI